MRETTATSDSSERPPFFGGRWIVLILAFLILIYLISSVSIFGWFQNSQNADVQLASTQISAAELEELAGLQVHLLGVTAGGGLIDFRLRIVNTEKAKTFLEDPENLPRLIAAKTGQALLPTESLDEDIEWRDGGVLFNMMLNSEGVIKPGDPVIVEFGSFHLSPIPAQ